MTWVIRYKIRLSDIYCLFLTEMGWHPVAAVQYTVGWHTVAAVQYTFTHKQYTEYGERNIHNNKKKKFGNKKMWNKKKKLGKYKEKFGK
jgi:hypothetical protein